MPEFDFASLKKAKQPNPKQLVVEHQKKKGLAEQLGITETEKYFEDKPKTQEKGKLGSKTMMDESFASEPEIIGLPSNGKSIENENKGAPFPSPRTLETALGKPQPKVKQFIPSFVMLFNGLAGAGKSKTAQRFPTPFVIDIEHGKNCEAIPYSDIEQIRNLRIGTMEDINTNKTNIDIVDVQGKTLEDTWGNIVKTINWYVKIGYKNHQTLVIDTAYWLRKSRTAKEEIKKGRQITQFEYRPVTGENQELIYDLIRECREKKLNLILITHWMGDYESITNERGFKESVKVGKVPDVKEWILDAVTWRIDFQKPEESGYKNKFIVYLDKAPKYQYGKIDITDKNLFEIINNLELFNEEIEAFKKIDDNTGATSLKDAFGGKEL